MITTTIDTELERQLGYGVLPQTEATQSDVLMIVLTSDLNMLAPNRVTSKQMLFGKTILDWVLASAGDFRTKLVTYYQNDNVLSLIRPHLGNEATTIVVYDDTPLLRHGTLTQILSDFNLRGQKVRKLPRGYMFDTEYIKTNEKIYASDLEEDVSEDFLCVNSPNALCIATMKLKSRITSYHLSNGVMILDPNSVYIDADVEIGSGAIIYPNNSIMGSSLISEGVTLLPNNVLLDCSVGANCTLLGCNLEKVRVQENSELRFMTKSNNITTV